MGVHNGGSELPGTLDSVLAQREVDLEFVVVDDGSSDETAGVLARYAREDQRLRVLTQANAGLSKALIAGCAVARAEFIARQDGGDVSLPGRFARQLALIRGNPDIGFVSCWTCFEGPNQEPLTIEKGGMETADAIDPLRTFGPHGVTIGPSCHPSVLFRRSCYERAGGYRSAFRYGQDWDLWYRMSEHGLFALVPQILYLARMTLNGISLTRKRDQAALSALSREAAARRREGRSDGEVVERAAALSAQMGGANGSGRAGIAAANYFVGEALRRRGDRRAARYLVESWLSAPWNAKALLRLAQLWLGPNG